MMNYQINLKTVSLDINIVNFVKVIYFDSPKPQAIFYVFRRKRLALDKIYFNMLYNYQIIPLKTKQIIHCFRLIPITTCSINLVLKHCSNI